MLGYQGRTGKNFLLLLLLSCYTHDRFFTFYGETESHQATSLGHRSVKVVNCLVAVLAASSFRLEWLDGGMGTVTVNQINAIWGL